MTRQEWEASVDPGAMLEFVSRGRMLRDDAGNLRPPTPKASDRKLQSGARKVAALWRTQQARAENRARRLPAGKCA